MTATAKKSLVVDDAAELREALAGLLEVMHELGIDEDTVAIAAKSRHCHMRSDKHLAVIKKAVALAAPLRNCDVPLI